MALTVLAAYDISEDRRRARVAATLQRWGDRIQLSLFLCRLETDQLPELIHAVKSIIDPQTDSFMVARQCAHCWEGLTTIGQTSPHPPTLYWAVM
ncbi:MAG: CRISPR-associated endonuclease Cas2 [Propionibacteriaceae bacterium]|jgi:CRISPR-associated protein Cas2|nr:CRISPR-associated endonuclease Cas2 [Propionibacteriaceae bacterium]